MPDAIQMRVAHQIAGRTRLVATGSVTSAMLIACRDRLVEAGGVDVEIRPASRSLVVNHKAPWSTLSGALAQARVHIAAPAPYTPIDQTRHILSALNDGLGQATAGRLDVINLAFLVLLFGGILQTARGNLGGPAATLFTQALTLAMLYSSRRPS